MSVGRMQPGERAIAAAFRAARAQGRSALIPYLTVGYPSPAASLELILALQEGGADLIELGVPFSDPVADGPAIQRASYVALDAGTTPQTCLALAAEARRRGVGVPLLLMGYYNPILNYGIERYADACAEAGVDGLIVPDLPPEEAGPLDAACGRRGLALIFLVAPTSAEERIAALAQATRGFLYVVSRLGTTGVGHVPEKELVERLKLVRRHAQTPVAVGFGLSRPKDMRALAPHADGLIVGSAIVERAPQGPAALGQYVASLRAALAHVI
jgi:tryptophan synthase alpha chain